MIHPRRDIELSAKKHRPPINFSHVNPAKKEPRHRRSLVSVARPAGCHQWPKNSHNRMITGIGTPISQSRIPRPIFASLSSSLKG
jgi:hypothetical protein